MNDEAALDLQRTLVLPAPTPTRTGKPLDDVIAEWLEEKAAHTGSARTLAAYSETLTRYRVRLQTAGHDLDEPDEDVLVDAARAMASARTGRNMGIPVARGTYNQRLAIISSFYEYARRNRIAGFVRLNPLERIKRQKDEEYAKATPLDPREVVKQLGRIDRQTLQGVRDYALLAIGVSTGRRMTELATMTWASVQIAGGVVTLTFAAKGGKVLRDELGKHVGEALMTWVYRWYGGVNIAPDSPIWVSLEANSRGHRLSRQAIAYICEKRLGTSKVHAMRHTFAHGMDAVGASVSEIQARLGHSNLATTGRYLAKLRSAKNQHADELAALFGIK